MSTANPAEGPVSPPEPSSNPVVLTQPLRQPSLLSEDTPAINAGAPVELDTVEITPEELKRRSTGGSGSLSRSSTGRGGVLSPDLNEEEEAGVELGVVGQGEGWRGVREKRAHLLESRSKDPGVIVDLPSEPTADEVAAAKASEGAVTPGLPIREPTGGAEA